MTKGILDPLGDGISHLELVDSMGNSLSVVNDARQSFDAKSVDWTDKDGKLLNYLARHQHTSPFRGVVFKWFVKAPLFVTRQWYKHTIASTYVDDQLGWNEKSFRYCSAQDEKFYVPPEFRYQSESNRQASAGPMTGDDSLVALYEYSQALEACRRAYGALMTLGVCREQARGVLPTCHYTSFVWTCSLQALFHFIALRRGEGAQSEITLYANALMELGRPVAPEAFDAFASNNFNF